MPWRVDMSTEWIEAVRYSTLVKASVAFLLLSTSARAFGLTDSDYDYLTTHNVPRDSSVLSGLSPKEQARLHAIITNGASDNDPAAQAKNVAEEIAVYQGHQLWERMHPGELWDAPKR
jgi:hypothetical protein